MDDKCLESALSINESQTENKMALILTIEVGSKYDGLKLGIAHLLEHMLLCFDRFQFNIGIKNYRVYGTTNFENTTYTLVCPDTAKNNKMGFQVLKMILNGDFISICEDFNLIKNDVLKEIERTQRDNLKWELFRVLVDEEDSYRNLPIGDYECIKQISIQDLLEFFDHTYVNAPFKISVISNLNKELCVKNYKNYFKVSDVDHRQKRKSNVNCVEKRIYSWNYEKGFGIYINMTEAQFFNISLKERVVEDISCMLIEDLMPLFLDINAFIYCHKLRYSSDKQFLAIEILQPDIYKNERLSPSGLKATFRSFFDFITGNTTVNGFSFVKTEYKKYMADYSPSLEEQIKDISNSLIYGDAIYKDSEYLRIIDTVKLDCVLKKIYDWLC